jgi:TolB-like protein
MMPFLLSLFIFNFSTAATVRAWETANKSSQADQTLDAQLDKVAREIAGKLSTQQKWKIAVIEFSDINGRVSNLGKFIAEELTTRLFSTGRFNVIERQLISNVLKEQKLGMTGILDEKSTKKVGAILGVDFIVTGTIADLGSTLKINARTIAMDTGAVLSVASAVLLKNDQIKRLTDAGGEETETIFSDTYPASSTSQKKQVTSGPTHTANTPGDIIIQGRLYFDGKPLSDYSKAAAKLRIYSQNLGQWITPAYDYDSNTASFTLHVTAEGSYSCNAEVDANPANPELYPGDYKGAGHFSAWVKSAPFLKIDMERLIHLVKPQDNGKPMVGWGAACFNKVLFNSPVRIVWEPAEKDVYYTYTINRTECNPFAIKEMVAGDTTTATNITIDLPQNKEGEIYMLQIVARKNGRTVGSLMTHGGNGWGWDYRFRAVK